MQFIKDRTKRRENVVKIEVDASSQFDSDVDAKGKGKRGTDEKEDFSQSHMTSGTPSLN